MLADSSNVPSPVITASFCVFRDEIVVPLPAWQEDKPRIKARKWIKAKEVASSRPVATWGIINWDCSIENKKLSLKPPRPEMSVRHDI